MWGGEALPQRITPWSHGHSVRGSQLSASDLGIWPAVGSQWAEAPGSSGPATGEVHTAPTCCATDGGAYHILARRAREGGPGRLGEGCQGAPVAAAHRHYMVRAFLLFLYKRDHIIGCMVRVISGLKQVVHDVVLVFPRGTNYSSQAPAPFIRDVKCHNPTFSRREPRPVLIASFYV